LEIIIPAKITSLIKKHIDKYSPLETKGALFAEHLGDNIFKIDSVYLEPKPGTTTYVKLVVNRVYQAFQNSFHKKHQYHFSKFNYIGDWHSHPLFECIPSSFDVEEVQKDLKNSNANFLVQLILKVNQDKLIGNAFYYSNQVSAKKIHLVIENDSKKK